MCRSLILLACLVATAFTSNVALSDPPSQPAGLTPSELAARNAAVTDFETARDYGLDLAAYEMSEASGDITYLESLINEYQTNGYTGSVPDIEEFEFDLDLVGYDFGAGDLDMEFGDDSLEAGDNIVTSGGGGNPIPQYNLGESKYSDAYDHYQEALSGAISLRSDIQAAQNALNSAYETWLQNNQD